MNSNPYKSAMEQIAFDKDFETEAIARMAMTGEKKKTVRLVRKVAFSAAGAAACIALVVFVVPFFFKPVETKSVVDPTMPASVASDTSLSATSFPSETSVPGNRFFVDPLLYDQGGTGGTGVPVQGEVLMSAELRAAVDDPANEGLWFNVMVYVLPPEQFENSIDEYVYNGRTMAEWLALLEEPENLNAQENYDAGKTEYGDKFGLLIAKAQENYRISECERLKAQGYDMFIYGSQIMGEGGNTWTQSSLAGYLTIDQIRNFSINPACGYGLEFDESAGAAPVQYAAPASSDIIITEQDPLPSVSLSSEVVNPNLYYNSDKYVSYPNAEPGQVILIDGLEDAVLDPSNDNSLFFVFIGMNTPEERTNSDGFNGYIYNGETIAQWQELYALARGEYSYSRYNEDHGGNITEEQWNQKKEEAITLHAEENCGAAIKEYSIKNNPITLQSIEDAEDSECERLKNLGYDVYIYEYQVDIEGEMVTFDQLAGTLTKEQILQFDANSTLGYYIYWAIINGEAIVKGQDSFKF